MQFLLNGLLQLIYAPLVEEIPQAIYKGVIIFQMYQLVECCYLKSTHPLCFMLVRSATAGVESACVVAQWLIRSKLILHLWKAYHFKWTSLFNGTCHREKIFKSFHNAFLWYSFPCVLNICSAAWVISEKQNHNGNSTSRSLKLIMLQFGLTIHVQAIFSIKIMFFFLYKEIEM